MFEIVNLLIITALQYVDWAAALGFFYGGVKFVAKGAFPGIVQELVIRMLPKRKKKGEDDAA